MIPKDCEECRARLPEWIEDTLDEPSAARLREHLEACPECHAELDWLVGLTADLEALGDALLFNAPDIDLVDAVMGRLDEVSGPPTVVPFRRRQARVGRWLAVAAAAAALAVVAGSLFLAEDRVSPPGVAGIPDDSKSAPIGVKPPVNDPKTAALLVELDKERQRVAKRLEEVPDVAPVRASDPPPLEATQAPELARLTVQDIVNERRKAITDPQARTQLAQWASLSREMARKVTQQPDAAPGAIVAAAEALEPDEAQPILLAAVGHHPEDPYLRMAATRKQLANPEAPPPTEHLEALRTTDADNALPLYLEAQERLAAGDVAGALQRVAEAASLAEVNAYTQEAAQNRALALEAAGMDPQAARLLTALTAGTGEYNFLCDLATDLLRYGQAYAEQGQSQEAQQIFEAVQQMGVQVQDSAAYSSEQLAGLDIQQQAVDSLANLYNQLGLGSAEAVRDLVTQTESLLGGINELGNFFGQLDQLLASDDAALSRIAEVILQQGDLNLFEVLFGSGG